MAAMLLGLPASAKRYEGDVVAVVDAIAFDHPDATLGVDAEAMVPLLRKQIRLDLGEDWQADLMRGARLNGLEAVRIRDHGILVSHPGTYAIFRACKELGKLRFAEAAGILEAAGRDTMGNPQAEVLESICVKLAEEQAEAARAEQAARRALQGSNGDSRGALGRYAASAQSYMERTSQALFILPQIGLSTQLVPVAHGLRKQYAAYGKMAEAARARGARLPPAKKADFADEMFGAVAGLKRRQEMATRELKRARLLYKDADFAAAHDAYGAATVMDPGNLEARAYVGWTQAAIRRQRRELSKLARKPWKQPAKAEAVTKVNRLARKLLDQQKIRDAVLLKRLVSAHKLPALLPRAYDAGWERNGFDEGRIGVIDGLSTLGGHFTGGDVLRASVTLGPRQDLSRYHELVVNNRSSIDFYMAGSLIQALGWLDGHSGGLLQNYQVVVHFQELDVSKGGDSLGAGLCTAAYSALYQLPIAHEMTLTGAIRAYGDIGPVGGVYAKVRGAVAAGKQVVVIPADNAPDASILSEAEVSQIRILTGQSIEDYLFHAFRGIPHRREEWAFSDSAYRAGRLYEQLSLLPQALWAYRRALHFSPNDLSSQRAIARIAERGVQPAKRIGWLTRAAEQGGDAATAFCVDKDGKPEELARLATDLAQLATQELARNAESYLGRLLVEAAGRMDETCRLALLTRGKLLKGAPISAPAEPVEPTVVADRLLVHAEALARSGEPERERLAAAYANLVTDRLKISSDRAMLVIGMVKEADVKLAEQLKRMGQVQTTGGESAVELKALQVPLPDLSRLSPTDGGVWNLDLRALMQAGERRER